ncbi:hypothetical protein INT44_000095 [Umbelopsis vinacea]|uniref:Fe2OG dioxygenase domain-containing protein n=1 Tax=Umbelopsis vinacea TaxID=44442 RepID=A0A8H7PHB2_9FUNG|nr:hypothetical protein INT44_000095 [Umbelopsis vinacea]
MHELNTDQLQELFGSDDSDFDDSFPEDQTRLDASLGSGSPAQTSEKFDRIPGLRLLRHGLSHSVQTQLLDTIISAEYFNGTANNQAMHFGDLPQQFQDIGQWAKRDTDLLENIDRDPLFDQAILNLYRPGEGIRSHVDLQKFDDGILIISLLSSCVMIMTPASEAQKHATNYSEEGKLDDGVPILLRPGDVLALVGPARWDWAHCIPARLIDNMDGDIIQRGSRVSITLRKLKCTTADTIELGHRQ